MVILLVDSNPAARSARATGLQQQGWQVAEASGAAEATQWLQQARELDCLVTEAVFDASTTGFGLRDLALQRFPKAAVLFTTRYDLTGFESHLGSCPVLADNPFPVEKLVAKVAEALSASAALDAPSATGPPPPLLPAGTLLGNNQIIDRLQIEPEAETYRALQRAVQRQVGLVVLRPELVGRPEIVREFKERERVKASITHPRIAPLYEAGEDSGWLFYTREIPPGRSLEEIRAAGEHLSEKALTDILFGIADAMSHASERGLHHRSLGARDIYVDAENQSSIVNIFRPPTPTPRDQAADVRALLALFRPLAAEGKATGLLQSLTAEAHDWPGLLQEIQEIRDEMRERSLVRKAGNGELDEVKSARKSKPNLLLWAAGAVILLIAAMLGAFAGRGYSPAPPAKPSEMIWIPEGDFVYQNGAYRKLHGFAISKFEITIGQYAAFLDALKKTAAAKQFDHPDQPAAKGGHTPEGWVDYYAAAASGASFNGQVIRLDSPITQVDWWDAFAYAKWKGQRLPTEDEWERAARGQEGRLFPWGNQRKLDAANLGDDYDPKGVAGGELDGYNLWAPVGKLDQDVSADGVIGMAGNVQEWTSTWATHPEFPDLQVPIVRGGHFGLKTSDQLLTSRYFAESPDEATLARGFRTASDQHPSS